MSLLGEHRQTFAPEEPHGWIQWKGTEVCMDVRCACGALGHVDASFAYYVQCPKCKRVYLVNPCVEFVELTTEEAKLVEPVVAHLPPEEMDE